MKYLFTIAFLLFCAAITPRFAVAQCAGVTTCTAASDSAADVQTALNSINLDNTTLTIPTGTGTWTGSTSPAVTYNQTYSTVIKGNSVIACTGTAGSSGYSCSSTDNTILVDNMTRGAGCGSPDNPMLQINAASGKTLRITGITFQFIGTQTCGGSISIAGTTASLRVDHNFFDAQYSTGLNIDGYVTGVIDHNRFVAPSGIWNAIKFQEGNWGGADALGVGDQSWAAATNFGSGTSAVYVEANYFYTTDSGSADSYADDCTSGGRFVWRFNTMIGSNTGELLQTHPTGGGQRHRGCRSEEIYQNYFGAAGISSTFNAFFLSSGPALIWGNTITSGYQNFVTIHSMRRDNTTYTQGATPNGWGYCGTSFDGTGSGWDQNSSTTTGYRCLDQPGEGQTDLLVNDFPNTVDNATGTLTWPNQKLEPVYEWLDTSSAASMWTNYETDAEFANADYYLNNASFTGTTGVGSGTLASRPSTCTAGVAYWATDQGSWNTSGNGTGNGILYVCSATNTWSTYYTPYSYPDPLIGGTPNAATPTAIPSSGVVPQTVTLSTTSVGAIICWGTMTNPSTNGSSGCTIGTLYSGPLAISVAEKIYFVAGGTGYLDSSVGSATYSASTADGFYIGKGMYIGNGTRIH